MKSCSKLVDPVPALRPKLIELGHWITLATTSLRSVRRFVPGAAT